MSGGWIERLTTGLWRDNPGLVQLLGLCPLLAVTSTFVNGVGLGVATLFVVTLSNALVSATRRWIRQEIRIPIYVLMPRVMGRSAARTFWYGNVPHAMHFLRR